MPHRVWARRLRRRVAQHHAGGHGAVGVRVDEDERPGARVPGVLVEEQRNLGAQRNAAKLVELQRRRGLVAVQRVDIEAVIERGHLGVRGAGGVLDDVIAAGLERRAVCHPAHRRVELLRDPGLVVGAGDQVSPRDVDLVGQRHGHGHRRERFFHRTIRALDRGDAGVLADGQHHDLVPGAHDAAGDGAGVAAVVLMFAGVRPDDVLHREPHVDHVAITGDVHLFEVRQQGRPFVPRRLVRLRHHVVAVQRGDRDGGHVVHIQPSGEGVELVADCLEFLFVPTDQVHLVDREHDVLDAEQGRQEGVPA